MKVTDEQTQVERKTGAQLFEEGQQNFLSTIKTYQEMVRNQARWMLPVIDILEKYDIPINSIECSQHYSEITLEDEIKLTQSAYDEIVKYLGSQRVDKTVQDQYVCFWFDVPEWDRVYTVGHIRLSNGKGTCKVEVTKKSREVPSWETTDTTYEVANGCSGMELG